MAKITQNYTRQEGEATHEFSNNIGSTPLETPSTQPSPGSNTLTLPRLRAFLIAITFVGASAELAYAVVNVSAMSVFIPTIGLTTAEANYWIGIVGTAFLLTEGALKGPFGILSDRIGRKPLILIGPIISLITALLTPLVHHPYPLVALRILDGIGAAALWPAIFSLIADEVPETHRATAMSLFNVAYIAGIAFGPFLGGNVNQFAHASLHMTESASKVASFYVAALLFGITALITYLYLPNNRSDNRSDNQSNKSKGDYSTTQAETQPETVEANRPGIWHIFRTMPLALLITFLIFLGVGFVMLYVKPLALVSTGPFHMTEQEFGNMLLVPALCIGALSVPMGRMGDKIGKPLAVKLGIGLCALAFWGILIWPGRITLLAFGTLVGLGFILAFPAWMALVTEKSDSRQHGAVVGAISTAQGLGAILGSIASAHLYPLEAITMGAITIPAHTVPFVMCGLMLSLAFILSLFVKSDRK